ncbi:MAG: T9SS type A sorting domain-containing protein [Bacteroidota bacterium]
MLKIILTPMLLILIGSYITAQDKEGISSSFSQHNYIIENFGQVFNEGQSMNEFTLFEGFLPIESSFITSTYISTLEDRVFIYPNPAREAINIHVPTSNSNSIVKIFNTNGSFIQRSMNESQMDISHLKPGVYFLELQFDNYNQEPIFKTFIKL